MRHQAKVDWWIVLVVLVGVLAPLASRTYWASGMIVGLVVLGALPQSYRTTPRGLLIRAGLTKRLVPYEAITFVGPALQGAQSVALSRDRVKVAWGPASELLIAPANREAFVADVAAHAPHLFRRGPDLVVCV